LNSKYILLLICLVLASGCGVKARPFSPPETAVSSYIESYTGAPFEEKKETPKNASTPK